MPTGETAVTDIALSPSGLSLFSAAADKVRVWDLRKFHSIGKLSGGHQAAVMCLATGTYYLHILILLCIDYRQQLAQDNENLHTK